jgi:histidyl-tRNA synthetase
MKKQMKYANDKNIPYVIMIGTKEISENLVTYKNMNSGEQNTVTFDAFLTVLKS